MHNFRQSPGTDVVRFCLLACGLIFTSGCDEKLALPKLEIERTTSGADSQGSTRPVAGIFVQKHYFIAGLCYFEPDEEFGPPEPRPTPRDILTLAGVDFPQGSSVVFDRATSTLRVINVPEEMAKVDVYVEAFRDSPQENLAFRVEFFEMPTAVALDLLRAIDKPTEYPALRKNVIAACHLGEAAFLDSSDLFCTSGLRAYGQSGPEVSVVEQHMLSDKGADNHVWIDTFNRGRQILVDPILMADGMSIDVEISLEDGDQQVETQLTLSHNEPRLIATLPGSSGNTKLVFAIARRRLP